MDTTEEIIELMTLDEVLNEGFRSKVELYDACASGDHVIQPKSVNVGHSVDPEKDSKKLIIVRRGRNLTSSRRIFKQRS